MSENGYLVAIADMKMPQSCSKCPLFHFYLDIDGTMHFICKYRNRELRNYFDIKRDKNCPLIEVDKGEHMDESRPGWLPEYLGKPWPIDEEVE